MDNDTQQPEITELEETKLHAEEYLNNWKRAQADFVNYKKDEGKRAEELVKFGNESIILEMVDVVGNLELAFQHTPAEVRSNQKQWFDGLTQVVKQFELLLKKYGVERIAVAGQKFDPTVHEAVGELDDKLPLVEARPGYTMHGKVIRPARVNNG